MSWLGVLQGEGRWSAQHPALTIHNSDGFVHSRLSQGDQELHNLISEWGVTQLVYMGVHLNDCILDRAIGLRTTASRWGLGKQRVAVARDLVDVMYNRADWPYVQHDTAVAMQVAAAASREGLRAASLCRWNIWSSFGAAQLAGASSNSVPSARSQQPAPTGQSSSQSSRHSSSWRSFGNGITSWPGVPSSCKRTLGRRRGLIRSDCIHRLTRMAMGGCFCPTVLPHCAAPLCCPLCCPVCRWQVSSQELVALGLGCWQVSSQEFVAAVLGGSVGRGLHLDAHVWSYQKSAVQSAIVAGSYWLEEAADQPTTLYLGVLLGLVLLGCSQQGSSICKALGSRITYAIPVNRSLLHHLRSI